jgi:predicted helicase
MLILNAGQQVYGYSGVALMQNVSRLIANYNDQLSPFDIFCTRRGIARRNEQAVTLYLGDNPSAVDEHNIKWSSSMRQYMARGIEAVFDPRSVRAALYRPFNKQRVYFNTVLNERTGQLPSVFPLRSHNNFGMFVPTAGSSAPDFLCLMTDSIPDLGAAGISGVQFFPRWTFEKVDPDDGTLALDTGGSGDIDEHGYRRVDNITDGILKLYREAIGDPVTKDDIFFYVYGMLHDPVYREAYAADLKKMLPHISTPETRDRFEQLASAGRALSSLHVGYEDVEPYPVDVQLRPGADPSDRETWRVSKLKWAKKKDPVTGKSVDDVTQLIYNAKVTITGIPEEAERYMLGSRSALAWIIDRYQVKTDKASGIVNDPNDWCDEHDDPRYIVDLIAKVTTVAVETMKIVDGLAEIG